jgi:hypothetical protein
MLHNGLENRKHAYTPLWMGLVGILVSLTFYCGKGSNFSRN